MGRYSGRPRTPQEAAARQAEHGLRREQSRGRAGGCGPLARGDRREAAVGRVRAEVVADSIEGAARSAHDDYLLGNDAANVMCGGTATTWPAVSGRRCPPERRRR